MRAQMTTPPILADRQALERNRARAARSGAPALFLQRAAASEIQERLASVNKEFNAPAVVSAWPELWRAAFPAARIVPDKNILGLSERSHDLVIHSLCMHWSDDPVGQMAQARRALRPDGLFLGALFGERTLAELRASLAEAEAAVSGGLSPRVAPMGGIGDLGGLLQRAGFSLPVADSRSMDVAYGSAFDLMRDLRAMGEANALAGRRRGFTRRAVLAEAARRYARAFARPDGRIAATFEIVYLTGWAPDAGQPRPLRPGSAKARLADALGTGEITLAGGAPRQKD